LLKDRDIHLPGELTRVSGWVNWVDAAQTLTSRPVVGAVGRARGRLDQGAQVKVEADTTLGGVGARAGERVRVDATLAGNGRRALASTSVDVPGVGGYALGVGSGTVASALGEVGGARG